MHIREGHNSSSMLSSKKVLKIHIGEEKNAVDYEQNILFSSMTKNNFNKTWEVDGKEVSFDLVRYLPAAEQSLVADGVNGKKVLELMVASGGKGVPVLMLEHFY